MTPSRLLLPIFAAALFSAPGQAQQQPVRPEPMPTTVRHAGTYHVNTGTWTRSPTGQSNFGPDVIYSNTVSSTYFTTIGGPGGFASGSTSYDEGLIPTSTNPGYGANRDNYLVTCLQIGYCDLNAAGTSAWDLSMYESYAPCQGAAIPTESVSVSNLPAAGGCWTVLLDLSGGGEFSFGGDGGNGYQANGQNTFGWSFRYAGSGTASAGFMMAGDPASTDPGWSAGSPQSGTNTYFGPPSLCGPGAATGLFTQDQWYIEDQATSANDGCYWFGGYQNTAGCGVPFNPLASFSFEVLASIAPSSAPFCASSPNSTGAASGLRISGSNSIAANNVTLTATVPRLSFGFFLTSQTPDFVAGSMGSWGNLCLGGSIGRFQQLAANSGVAGLLSISTTTGAWSLANIPQGTGPYAAAVGDTTYFQCWHRDSSPAGPTSNFSSASRVTWTL